jgi:hypothetical protein
MQRLTLPCWRRSCPLPADGRPRTVDHPFCPRLFVRQSVQADRLGFADRPAQLLEGLSGRVLEIGAGNGLNFRHYPPRSTRWSPSSPSAVLARVYSGSVCGRGLSATPRSTIGFERRHNRALLFDSAHAFVEALLQDSPPAPADQAAIVTANRSHRALVPSA